MRRPGSVIAGIFCAAAAAGIGSLIAASAPASAQVNEPPARSPCSVLDGEPCHPSFCDPSHRSPCLPEYLPALGEDLRLTIVSTDRDDQAGNSDAAPGGGSGSSVSTADRSIDTIGAMFEALRACWLPPARDAARHGMEYTVRFAFRRDGELLAPPQRTYSSHDAPAKVRDLYRDAVDAALQRCVPLHFSDGMGGAVAGRPIAVRFVDNRTINTARTQH